LLRKLSRKSATGSQVTVADKLGSYGVAREGMDLPVECPQHEGLNDKENKSQQREQQMKPFKSARFLST
jgi:hypothetical protein